MLDKNVFFILSTPQGVCPEKLWPSDKYTVVGDPYTEI